MLIFQTRSTHTGDTICASWGRPVRVRGENRLKQSVQIASLGEMPTLLEHCGTRWDYAHKNKQKQLQELTVHVTVPNTNDMYQHSLCPGAIWNTVGLGL